MSAWAAEPNSAAPSGYVVHFQPVVRLDRATVVGVESLVRRRSPAGDLVLPTAFLPELVDSDDMATVTDLVLREAVALLRASPGAPWWVSVNLSTADLVDCSLEQRVSRALTGIDPSRLVLELSENLVPDAAAQSVVDVLAARGARIALDDLGSPRSSVGQLDLHPIGLVKLDRRVTRALGNGVLRPPTLRGFVETCRERRIEVIAEGIETEAELALVRASGCNLGQGFYWSAARPAEELRGMAGLEGWPIPGPSELRPEGSVEGSGQPARARKGSGSSVG